MMGHHYSSCVTFFIAVLAVLLSLFYNSLMMDKMYKAEYMSEEDFYKTFKVFKENLREKGPTVVSEALKNHRFASKQIKVRLIFSSKHLENCTLE